MKKILITAIAVGLLSTSAMAVDGKISQIQITAADLKVIKIIDGATSVEKSQKLVGTPEAIKAMLAVVLTAKASNADVTLTTGTGDNGTGWNNVILK